MLQSRLQRNAKGFEHFTKQNTKEMLWLLEDLTKQMQRECQGFLSISQRKYKGHAKAF